MNLYVFYLGGNAGKSNIEVHDIRFVAVEKPEDAWPLLRAEWFGDKNKIHVDGYAKLTWADGFDIALSGKPADNGGKYLWFVNVGAYRKSSLTELHAFDFFVAESAAEAKTRALEKLLPGEMLQHKDNLKEVDDCLQMERVGSFFVSLTPNENGTPFVPEWQGYLPIAL